MLDTPQYLSTVGRYVHRNPIDVRPSVPIDQYRWSSLRHYAGHAPAPPWLTMTRLLGEAGGAHDAYLRQVLDVRTPSLDPDALLAVIAMLVEERRGDGRLARRLAIAALDMCDRSLEDALIERLCLQPESLADARVSATQLVAADRSLGALLESAFRRAA